MRSSGSRALPAASRRWELGPDWALFTLGVTWVVAGMICPFFGAEPLALRHIAEGWMGHPNPDADIFFMQRIPRVILGMLAGGTLAAVGASFQVILRNPLAEPFTLGVTGGAAVGAVLALSIPGVYIAWGPFSSVQLFALVGGGAALSVIYLLSARREGLAMNTLLLAGVTISIFCGSMVMLIRYLLNPHLLVQMDRWLMGGLDPVGYRQLASLFPLLLPGLGLLVRQAMALNHLVMGEELAIGHGVDVQAVRKETFIGGGLATAAVVALVGPIGFVGLLVPHAVRRICGYDHRFVLPASFLLGGTLLAVCDTAARTVAAPAEMPVGIVTAIVGCPVFVGLLLRSNRT